MIRFVFIFFVILLNLFGQNKTIFDEKDDFVKVINSFHNKQYEKSTYHALNYLRNYEENEIVRYFLGLSFFMSGYGIEAVSQWETLIVLNGIDYNLKNKIDTIKYFQSINFKEINLPLNKYIFSKSFNKIVTGSSNSFFEESDSDIYIHNNSKIYLLDYKKGQLVLKNIDGKILKRYNLRLKFPTSITYYRNNIIIISDFGNNQLVFFDVEKEEIVRTIGKKGIGNTVSKEVEFLGPYSVAVGEEYNLYVVDSGNSRVKYITPDGMLLNSFGVRGNDVGELFLPTFIFIHDGLLYVSDTQNSRISIYNQKGVFLEDIGSDFLNRPKKIMYNPLNKNYFIILDDNNIYFYDYKTGEYSTLFSNSINLESLEMLSYTMDNNGMLYILDGLSKNINVYSPEYYAYHNMFVNISSVNLSQFPKVFVELTALNDMTSKSVVGLLESHFNLYENGLEREFSLVKNNKSKEKNITILLENSQKINKFKEYVKFFLTAFDERLESGDEYSLYTFGGEKGNEYQKLVEQDTSVRYGLVKIDDLKGNEKYSVGTAMKMAINDLLHSRKERIIWVIVFDDYHKSEFFPENYKNLLKFASENMIVVKFIYMGNKDISNSTEFSNMREFGYFRQVKSLYKFSSKSDMSILVDESMDFNMNYVISYDSFENKYLSKSFRPIKIHIKYFSMQGEDNNGFIIP